MFQSRRWWWLKQKSCKWKGSKKPLQLSPLVDTVNFLWQQRTGEKRQLRTGGVPASAATQWRGLSMPAPSEGFQPSASFKPRTTKSSPHQHRSISRGVRHTPQAVCTPRWTSPSSLCFSSRIFHLSFLFLTPAGSPASTLPAAAKSAQTRCSFPALRPLPFQGRVTSLWRRGSFEQPWSLQLCPTGSTCTVDQLVHGTSCFKTLTAQGLGMKSSLLQGTQGLLGSSPSSPSPTKSPQPLRGHSASPSRKEAQAGSFRVLSSRTFQLQRDLGFPIRTWEQRSPRGKGLGNPWTSCPSNFSTLETSKLSTMSG